MRPCSNQSIDDMIIIKNAIISIIAIIMIMATKMQEVMIKIHNAMDLMFLKVIFPSSDESPSVSSASPSIYKISYKKCY